MSKTKSFRIGKFLTYQHSKDFMFWSNDLYIVIKSLNISICWNRTAGGKRQSVKWFKYSIALLSNNMYKELLSN
jgi:hypothetical protein